MPPDPVTPAEKRSTLLRLNQIIQQRLVTSSLPNQMRNLKIGMCRSCSALLANYQLLVANHKLLVALAENGRVTFHCNYEFEMSLTLMGDGLSVAWRVLSIDILVMDKETGDGRDLVHPLQKNYLQEFVQHRLSTADGKPLVDAYNVLRECCERRSCSCCGHADTSRLPDSFCLSLQLEVLHAQAIRLSRERLGDFIKLEEYVAGKRLSLLYWRDPATSDHKQSCKLVIEIDGSEQAKPLQVTHHPELGQQETLAANDAIKSDHLSIEKLLIHTVHERAKQSLTKLRAQLDELNAGETALSGCPTILSVSFIKPCMQSERLLVSVDQLTGVFLAHIPQFGN